MLLRNHLMEWLATLLVDHRILPAANGPDALQILERERPGFLLVELKLPGMNGLELVRLARERSGTVRIAATSWYESRFLRESAYSAGADAFIPKHKLHAEFVPTFMQRELYPQT